MKKKNKKNAMRLNFNNKIIKYNIELFAQLFLPLPLSLCVCVRTGHKHILHNWRRWFCSFFW